MQGTSGSSLPGVTTSNEPDSPQQQISRLGSGGPADADVPRLPLSVRRSGQRAGTSPSSCSISAPHLHPAPRPRPGTTGREALSCSRGPCPREPAAWQSEPHLSFRYPRSEFLTLQHGELALEFIFTRFSAAPHRLHSSSQTPPALRVGTFQLRGAAAPQITPICKEQTDPVLGHCLCIPTPATAGRIYTSLG